MNTQRSTLESDRPEKYTPLYPSLDGNEPNKLFNQVDYTEVTKQIDNTAKSNEALKNANKLITDQKKEDEATVSPQMKTEIPQADGTKNPDQNLGENSKPENSTNVVKTTQEAQKLTLAADTKNNGAKEGQSVFEQDIIREAEVQDKIPKNTQGPSEEKVVTEAKLDEF